MIVDYSDRLRASEWFVGDADLRQARRFIAEHHYAGGASNTAVYCHGLCSCRGFDLSGVAWWLPPINVGSTWPVLDEVLGLSRLVIAPDVPKNAATFLLSRSVRLIDPKWRCLVTYADTWRGHTGHIYRAAGWEYLGLTKPERVYLRDGRMVSRKAGPRSRTHAEMIASGAEYIGSFPKHKFRLVRRSKVVRVPRDSQRSLF